MKKGVVSHVSLQRFIEVAICTVSWIGGCAKAGLLPSTFKVKTRQSGIPRTGLGVSPMQTGVWAVGGQVDWSVSNHQGMPYRPRISDTFSQGWCPTMTKESCWSIYSMSIQRSGLLS